MKITSQAATDTGRVRAHNEDRYYAHDGFGVYAIADGLGGSRAGEVASQIFVETVEAAAGRFHELAARFARGGKTSREELLGFLHVLFQQASRTICERASTDSALHGMSTTGVVLGVLDGLAVVGHVGDSRAYLVRGGTARQLTCDHTVFQRLVDHGLIAREGAADFPYKNLLERSVGDRPHCQVDTLWIDLQAGDRFLLCTDGLTQYLNCERLQELTGKDVRLAVAAANEAGGADNITVIALTIGDEVARVQLVDTESRMHALSALALFRGLTFPELLLTMKMVRERRCLPGERVVGEGEPGDSLFVVVEGTLDVIKGGNGAEVQLASLGPRDHFGEIAFLDRQPRSANVVARTAAVLLDIGREGFQALVTEHPALANKLLTNFVIGLAHRLRMLAEDYVVEKRR